MNNAKTIFDQFYMLTMRPVFNVRALFSDTTENYVTPMEPKAEDTVNIRFRTAKNNVDDVFLLTGDERIQMVLKETVDEFDYYSLDVQMSDKKFVYCFEICSGKLSVYYDVRGVTRDLNEYYFFSIIPGFSTPDWAKGAVMYQIYVDRFRNGDPENDVCTDEYYYVGGRVNKVDDWLRYPSADGVREFYGGDLQGVLEKLDYLKDLGVEVIYFNPLFVSPSNHKYDIQDYDSIDPHFGKIVNDGGDVLPPNVNENRLATRYITRVTDRANLEASNELFAHVVEEAHARGMKVILDGVFN
nr:alpha amylase N-terminal ig-like domain-containing protein [Lachnospiraceae bacterium]